MATVTETFVGQKNDTTATTHVFSGVNIAAGKLAIIRLIVSDGVTVNNPTDSAGNTWAVAISAHDPGANEQTVICYSVLTAALSSGTVTINLSATSTCGAELAYFDSDTGWLAQASVLDKTKSAIGSVAAWSTGAAATTTQADELLVAACGKINFNGSSSLPDSPWIEETDQVSYTNVGGSGLTTVWQKVTSTGAYTASGVWQSAEFWHAAMATFKTAAGGAAPTPTADHPLVANAPKGFMFRGLSREDFTDVAIDYSFFRGANTPRKRFIAAQAGGFYFAPAAEPVTFVTSADTGVGTDGGLVYLSEVISDNPAAYWRLGASPLVDSSVNGNTLSIPSGTPGSFASLLATDSDGSRDFNGSTQYYIAADSPSLSLTAPLTIEAWVVADAVTGDREIVRKDTIQFLFRVESGVIQYYYDDGSPRGVSATTSVTTGVLYHLVVTDDGTTVRFYINGVLDRSVARPTGTAAIDTTGAVGVGATHNGGGGAIEFWDGRLDEVALYATALSATAIADHYRAGVYSPLTSTASISASDTGTGVDAESVTGAPVSKNSSDVNGATTESATLVALISTADVNGATTEATSIQQAYTSADTGTGTETQLVTVPISASDTNGTTTEAVTLAAAIPTSDTGAGVNNTGTVLYAIPASDVNGATTESITLVATGISSADVNGATTESVNITVPVAVSDTGAGVDAISALKSVTADTATDSEAATLVATGISSSDVNGATTENTTLTAVYTSADLGNSLEGISDRKIVLDDSAVGADSQSVLTPGSAADNEFGSGADVASVTKALLSASETATDSEVTILVAAFSVSDTNGTTTEATRTFLTSADTGSGVDVVATLVAPASVTDTGAGSDTATLVAVISTTEAGVGVDNATVLAPGQFFGADVGVGIDSISALRTTADEIGSGIDAQTEVAKFTVAEAGSGAEAQAVTVPVSAADTGAGVNAQSLSAAFSAPETASGLDTASTGLVRLTTAESASGIELQILQARLSSFDISFGVDYGVVETGYTMTGNEPQWMIDARIDGTLVDVVIASRMKSTGIAQPMLVNAKVE